MARIEVPMPQMGESIAEGTVSRWLKQVGEFVRRDEPILEISTDKVDAEIPSPADGVLVEIHAQEGDTVEVGTVVAHIDPEAAIDPGQGGPLPTDRPGESPTQTEGGEESFRPLASAVAVAQEPEADGVDFAVPEAPPPSPEAAEGEGEVRAPEPGTAARTGEHEVADAEERLRTRSTPLVRRIAEEHGIDLSSVPGSGLGGRVTKKDILHFIETGVAPREVDKGTLRPAAETVPEPVPGETPDTEKPAEAAAAPSPGAAAPRSQEAAPESAGLWERFYREVQHPEFPVRSADRVEPMDKIRRLTAEHMVLAKRVAPHVHSFIEIDFTRIDSIRAARKAQWAEQGVKVSYTAFVAWACARLLREFPRVNATISGNNLIYRGNVNVGIAVDLDPGLIVPVVHDADELSLVGMARRIMDLAERARTRRLNPDEIQGATFSITNPGVLGTLVGMPIIPKGTAAILGTGAIEKRVAVIPDPATRTDVIAIRKRALFSLGYDHRIVDGADAARFLARLKELLETFPEDA